MDAITPITADETGSPDQAAAAAATFQAADTPKPARNLGPLRMIWREALRYPGQMAIALLALLVTASATLAIPAGFRLIIDRGFSQGADVAAIGRWFQYLLLVVAVLALGTAVRFYFVSWLGERVVADIRLKVQANLLRLPPSFFEANSPREISSRMTADPPRDRRRAARSVPRPSPPRAGPSSRNALSSSNASSSRRGRRARSTSTTGSARQRTSRTTSGGTRRSAPSSGSSATPS